MIKIVQARLLDPAKITLRFSDGSEGVFDAGPLLQGSGSLLAPLRSPEYFARFFLELGALCWPNGLELSPTALYQELKAGGNLSAQPVAA